MTLDTRSLARQLGALKQRSTRLLDFAMERALLEPVYLTNKDIVDEDFDLPEAWKVKLTPSSEADLGYTQSLISPEGAELAFEDVFVSPEGVWMMRPQLEAEMPTPAPIPEAVFATPDEELLYREYQRTGGTFDVETWTMIGGPIRPSETDIETLLNEILEAGRTTETEALLLRLAPDATEADIEAFFTPAGVVVTDESRRLFGEVFPEGLNVDAFMDLGMQEPDELLRLILMRGDSEATRNLIKSLWPSASEETIEKLFTKELPPSPPDEEIRRILEIGGVPNDEIEKLIEQSKLELDAEGWLEQYKEIDPSLAKDFMNSLPMRSISAGYGDLVSGAAGLAGWAGNEQLQENLMGLAKSFQNVAPPTQEWDASLKTLLDPRFWSTVVARALPFSVAMIPIGLLTFGTGSAALAATGMGAWKVHILAAIFGGASGAVLESSFEAGSVWNRAKDMGWTDEDANKAAQSTFTKNVFALTGTNAIELFAAFLPDPTGVLNRLVGKGLATVTRVGGKITTVALTEGGEEVVQGVIERQALGLEVKWDDEMKMQFMIGIIMGLGMGGGANVLTTIANRTAQRLPVDLKAEFDTTVANLKADGASDMQAKVEAFDKIADNKEVQDITDQVIEEVIKEESVESVKKEDKAEELAWEHIAEPEAVVAPVSPAVETFLATPNEQILRATNEIRSALEARGFSRDFIDKMSFPEMKQALRQPIPKAVPEVGVERVDFSKVSKDLTPEQVIGEVPEVKAIFDKFEATKGKGGRIALTYNEQFILRDFINLYAKEHKLVGTVSEGFGGLEVILGVIERSDWRGTEYIVWNPETNVFGTHGTTPEAREIARARGQYTEAAQTFLLGEPVAPTAAQPPAVAKPPVPKDEPIIPPTEPVASSVVSNTQGMRDLGAKEVVRPARKVLIRIGQWRQLFKPTQEAEVLLHEEQQRKTKMFDKWQKLLGRDKERWALVSDEINEQGSVVGLTFDERRVVTEYRKWADEWANRKNLAEGKRIKDYMPHLFEQEATRQVKEEGGIDPVLAQLLSERETKKIADPFLKKRLGAVGWIKDPVSAARAYEAVSLKFAYYTPLLNKIDAMLADPNIPGSVKRYLSGYSKRMTGEQSDIDKSFNVTIRGFAEVIKNVPGIGPYLYPRMTQGNPIGMASYHLTGGLYGLFLGYKATSAIRNLSQHGLTLGEVGPKHFANGIRLRVTREGRTALRKSLVLRSRKFAYTAGLDSSYINRWTDKFREAALYMFRLADKQNVSDAFLAGYSEAKEFYPEANEQVWIDRGDEVAADTQYLYTKMNSMSFSQNAPGRTMAMLTTWTENWIELMTKWIRRTPSQVYAEQERVTGKAIPKKNWSQTHKAILLYMTIVGLAFAFEDESRLKLKEYTGVGSLRYLAGAVGGEFPALEAMGSVADMIAGFLTDDERMLKSGLAEFRSTFTPGIVRQLSNVGSGEKDWMTLLFYLEGKDFFLKQLKDKWSKDFKPYEALTPKERTQYRKDNPLIEAKQFVVGQFTTLSSDEARAEVLRLIEEHNIDTELINGYEKVFGVDTKAELDGFQKQIGTTKELVAGEEVDYFTTSNFASEVNRLVKLMGRAKVEKDGNKLAIEYLEAKDSFEAYDNLEEADARILWRKQFPDVEALLYLFGKVASFRNPKSAEILLNLMKKYDIPPEAVPAFLEDPERYDELLTPVFELKQKTYDLSTQYEDYGNTESPIYIADDDARTEARDKLKHDNPEWVDDMRRIDAIEYEIPENQIEDYVEHYKIERKGYEDDWFLMEHPEFYKSMVDFGIWKPKDFSKVPSREVNTLYVEWEALRDETGKALGSERRAFEAAHPDLDQWLHLTKGTKLESERNGVTTTVTEEPKEETKQEPPKEEIDPALDNRRYWLDQASHYKDILKNLGIREDITAEELTDAQADEIETAIVALRGW